TSDHPAVLSDHPAVLSDHPAVATVKYPAGGVRSHVTKAPETDRRRRSHARGEPLTPLGVGNFPSRTQRAGRCRLRPLYRTGRTHHKPHADIALRGVPSMREQSSTRCEGASWQADSTTRVVVCLPFLSPLS